MILKASNKSVWSNVFSYVKICIFWKCIQYGLFFLSRAPTYHSFTFNLRFWYELKHKARLSETVCGIFHFRFRFVFIKVYIFVQQSAWTLWLSNFITPFKIKIIEKPHIVLLPDVWFLSCNKKFFNSMISTWVGAPQKLTWWKMI